MLAGFEVLECFSMVDARECEHQSIGRFIKARPDLGLYLSWKSCQRILRVLPVLELLQRLSLSLQLKTVSHVTTSSNRIPHNGLWNLSELCIDR